MMAYDQIAQVDCDVLSEGSNSVTSGSPPPDDSFRPIPMEFENLGGNLSIEASKANENSDTRLGSMMRSMASTGTSYDMLEDDDYEHTQETPVKKKNRSMDLDPSIIRPRPHSSSPGETGRLRTASIGPKFPLRHPTPDLQSVQGAYVKNVERLEESAERLSMTSSLGEELQKMKFEQRREQRQTSAPVGNGPSVRNTSRQVSAASLSNSIVGIDTSARSGGHSSSRHVTSPKSSMLSGSWSHTSNTGRPTSKDSRFAQPLPDHGIVQTASEYAPQHVSFDPGPPEPPPHTYQPGTHVRRASVEQSQRQNTDEAEQVRPSTSASNDTYRQATTLFAGFDGVTIPLTRTCHLAEKSP
jgi:hypothetical protein